MRAAAAVLAMAALALCARAAETVQAVLSRMDQEAAAFHQVQAKVRKAAFTAVLNDTSEESGTMWLKRASRDLSMRVEITQPEPRSVGVEGAKALIYYPKINTVQIYDLGKQRGLVDQFLVLGFGSHGRDILKNYNVTVSGEETIAGQKTSRLELLPKDKQVQEQFKKIELWVPVNAGHPIRERLLQPGGDYYLFTYSDIQMNPNLPDNQFRLNLPAGVKKDYPQK